MTETTTREAAATGADGQPATRLEVMNPATGEVIALVRALSVGEVAGVVARAR
ncbi:MAG: hypothetical protein ICV69_10330, partial [Thermoleophilaceae bacterium]|nr:hypothetical protein [Thermoleophilaceae bacterium]